jgi:hypothetical protein
MQANQRKTMEIARTELNQMLTELAQDEVKRIVRIINEKLSRNEEIDLQRQIYATMDPIDVLHDLMEICRDLCQSKSNECIECMLFIVE